MKRSKKQIPKFRTEDAERQFWAKHSPLDYFDLSTAQKAVFSNLKPSLRTISIRLPEGMVDTLKVLANKQDVPYQSLAKIYLAKQIKLETSPLRKKAG